MKVLILDEDYRTPPLDGGARSLWDLHRSLRELGHDASISGDSALLEEPHWEVVMVSRPLLAARLADRARRAASSHTVYIGHDFHYRRLTQPDGVLPEQPRPVGAMAAVERYCWENYDVSIYPNPSEVAEAATAGADARWFPYFRIDEGPQRAPLIRAVSQPGAPESGEVLLFVGGSSHTPNVTGLRWFAAQVLPTLGDVKVVVVGPWETSLRAELASAGLTFTGPLTDAELDETRNNALANIAPLTAGAGLKSKVIAALASGIPLVATSQAMDGITDPWRLALPGDEPEQWLDALSLMRRLPDAVAPLVRVAQAYVRTHHGRDAYLAAVQSLLRAQPAHLRVGR